MDRRLKKILVVSIVLNALLIGMFAGQESHRNLMPANAETVIAEGVAKLTPQKRKLFEDALHGVIKDMQDSHAQLVDGKQQISRLLTASQFDEQAYLAEIKS